MKLRRSSLMDFRLILKGILKGKFKLINSLMKSRAILESLKKDIKWYWDCFCSLHLGQRIFGALPILCAAGFRGRKKWITVYQTERLYPWKLSWLRRKEVCAWNEFEKLFVSFSTVLLKCEVKFFIREFLEVFYFPSAFIGT